MHQPLVLRKNMANRINVFTVLPYDEHTTYGISIETTTTIPLQQKQVLLHIFLIHYMLKDS